MTSLWLETLALEDSEAMDEKHSSGYNVLLQALLIMAWDWEEEEEVALLLEFLREVTPATMPTTVATRNKVAKRANKRFFLLFLLDNKESEILEKGCLILLMV